MLSFIKNRPPLIVIFLCIFTATITLTYFAFYISTSDFIVDNDVIYNWNQLLRHFSDFESCVEEGVQSDKEKTGSHNSRTVNTVISISPSDFDGYPFVKGNFLLEGWHPVCDKNSAALITFEIAFQVPKSNLSQTEVCANIAGPEEFLPKFIEPNCNLTHLANNKVTGKLSTSKKKYKEFCPKGTLTKILFFPPDKENFANYLSVEMKETIYVHLLSSVYILFGILLGIFIYAFLKSHQHIKYMEKCSHLIQGR